MDECYPTGSAQAKPPRKRRRCLIVAFILVGVLAGALWLAPRGHDGRFVGYWQTNRSDIWRLEPDGTLSMFASGRSHPSARWAVEGNRLYILPRGSAWLFALSEFASELIGGRIVPPWRKHEIESVSRTVINLTAPAATGPNSQFTLQRIPNTE
jgi:hypothetical protein